MRDGEGNWKIGLLNSEANTGESHISYKGSVAGREKAAMENGIYDREEGRVTKKWQNDLYC